MDLGSILLILALLVLVGLFVARPLLEKERAGGKPAGRASTPAENAAEHDRSTLLAEHDRLLNALQELDFDFALGKIPQEDYPTQRQALLHQGADVLRRLDGMQPSAPIEDAETRLESAIAVRRADAALAGAPLAASGGNGNGNGRKRLAGLAEPDDQLEALLANRRRERGEKATGFCHRCGGPLQKSDRFCPKCGAKID